MNDPIERLACATNLVYAFRPRRSDPPFYVAQSRDELAEKQGELVPGDQCDYCGNSCYRIERVGHGSPEPIYGFTARCVTDPDQDEGEGQPTGCGIGHPISLWNEDDVQGF